MKWKDFTESSKEYPEKVVEISINGFHNATKGLAEIIIEPVSELKYLNTGLRNDFTFNVYLMSPFLSAYSFKLFSIGYNIELSPIYMLIEHSIHDEVLGPFISKEEPLIIENEEELKQVLENIFNSTKFSDVVTGVMKIAAKNKKQ